MRAYQDYQDDQDEPARDDNDEMETIHVYMLREPLPPDEQPERTEEEDERTDRWLRVQQWVMGCIAMLMLSAFTLVPDSPVYVTRTISVPAIPLPIVQLQTSVPIVATGVTTIPAHQAHGILTIYNGLSIIQQLPAGFVVTSRSGVEVTTDEAVTIQAAQLPAAGVATVAAHTVTAGAAGNIAAGAVNQDDGSSLVVKNLLAFSGGLDASTRQYVTSADMNNARASARAQLTAQKPVGLLPRPCTESEQQRGTTLSLAWRCQYVTYRTPLGVTPIHVQVQGNQIILTYRDHLNT